MPKLTLPSLSLVCQNTGRWCDAKDVPKSNVAMRFTHKLYCTITGLSKLYSSRNFCRDSSLAFGLKLASLVVMSPGARCMIKKEIRLIPINSGTIQKTRFSRYLSMMLLVHKIIAHDLMLAHFISSICAWNVPFISVIANAGRWCRVANTPYTLMNG